MNTVSDCKKFKIKANMNLKLKRTDRKKVYTGLTLVETLIAFGLSAVILIILAAFYLTQFKFFSGQNTSIDISSQNKIAIDEITNEIRESQSVAASCCSSDTTSSTVLVLQIWPLNSNGDTQDPGTTNYDYIVYQRDSSNNTITKKITPSGISSRQAGTKIIASNVSDLQFTYDTVPSSSAEEVTVTITTTAVSMGKTHTNTQTTSAILRNK